MDYLAKVDLRDPDSDEITDQNEAIQQAESALEEFLETQGALDAAADLLVDSTVDLRNRQALAKILRLPHPDAARRILLGAPSDIPGARCDLLRVFYKASWSGVVERAAQMRPILPYLLALTADDDPAMRIAALHAVGVFSSLRDPVLTIRMLAILRQESDPNIRTLSLMALKDVQDPGAIQEIVALLSSRPEDTEVRDAAILLAYGESHVHNPALARALIPMLSRIAGDTNDGFSSQALEALSLARDPGAKLLALRAAQGESDQVPYWYKHRALYSLRYFLDDPGVIDLLGRLASDPDYGVAATAGLRGVRGELLPEHLRIRRDQALLDALQKAPEKGKSSIDSRGAVLSLLKEQGGPEILHSLEIYKAQIPLEKGRQEINDVISGIRKRRARAHP